MTDVTGSPNLLVRYAPQMRGILHSPRGATSRSVPDRFICTTTLNASPRSQPMPIDGSARVTATAVSGMSRMCWHGGRRWWTAAVGGGRPLWAAGWGCCAVVWNRVGGWCDWKGVDVVSAVRERVGGAGGDFEVFYRRSYPVLRRFAWLLTRSDVVAEDVTQEAFLAVYRRFGAIEDPERYARRTVVNLARSHARRELVRVRKGHLLVGPAVVGLGAEELVDLVAGLPYRQRVVVVARYWAGWSEAEIAVVLGCRPGTVKSLASRALARLGRELGDADG